MQLENKTDISTIKDKGFSIKSLLQNSFFVNLLKLTILVVLLLVLYFQVFGRTDLTFEHLILLFVQELSWANFPLIFLATVLMPVNWYFETKKWTALMQKIEPISWSTSLKTVLLGLSISMFTPNRVGEYGGRLLMVSSENRLKAVFAVLVGVSSQWIVLVIFGWWALVISASFGVFPIHNLFLTAMFFWGLVGTLFLCFLYFNLQIGINYCLRFRWTSAWAKKIQTDLYEYSVLELVQSLNYSILRFFIYTFQYLLLLYFFGFDANFFAILLGVMIVYLLQTSIPLPPSTGLIARGNIALLIFGYFSANSTVAVLASTFSLWLINIVLPAILGAFFMNSIPSKNTSISENY